MDKQTITKLTEAFRNANFELFLVGGAVRDKLRGVTPHELDFTTDAKPGNIKQILKSCRPSSLYTIGEKFGTIGAQFNDQKIEITTYRQESYIFGSRHPKVDFATNLEKDLSRRDFTINAIVYDEETQKYLDPFNGHQDINNKIIRSVGRASERFQEDPLRILRAIRFAVTLDFDLEPSLIIDIQQSAPELATISAERISDEFNKILQSDKPSRGIRFLTELNLLPYILPEFIPLQTIQHEYDEHKNIYEHTLQVLDSVPPTKRLRWLALLHDIAKPQTKAKVAGKIHFFAHEIKGAKTAEVILSRLRFDAQFIKEISLLIKTHLRINLFEHNWTDGAIKRLVLEVGPLLDDLIQFSYADITTKRQEKRLRAFKKIDQFVVRLKTIRTKETLNKIKSPLSGDELMKIFKKSPGPWIKPIKQHLLDLVIDGKLSQDDRIKATKIAQEFLKNNDTSNN